MEGTQVCSKTWELSLYELHRIPHEVKTDDIEINVSPRSLHSEVMCPICLDVLKNTMTTKECLHRFCQECIITALRSGNKECPTCRKKLVSKRSLRPDPNFDALISKIFPSRDEYEAQQENVLAQIKQNTMVNSYVEGIRQQVIIKAGPRKGGIENPAKNVGYSASSGSERRHSREKAFRNASSNYCSQPSLQSAAREVEVIMLPHPDGLDSVDTHTRYLKTTANATVEHLSNYLTMRTAMDNKSMMNEPGVVPTGDTSYIICVASSDNERGFAQLSGDKSLADICDLHWKSNRPLELFYALDSSH